MANDYESMMRACHLAWGVAEQYGIKEEVEIAKRVAALAKARQYPDIVKTTGWLTPLVAIEDLHERLYGDALLDHRALAAAVLAHSSENARSNPIAHITRLFAQAARTETVISTTPPVEPERIAHTINTAAQLWSLANDTAELYVGAPSPADVTQFLVATSNL